MFKLNLIEKSPITDEMMKPALAFEKGADVDLLREIIGFAAEKLMELEVGAKTRAAYGEQNAFRLGQRDDYREQTVSSVSPWRRWSDDWTIRRRKPLQKLAFALSQDRNN